jgi:AraC family transcriptional regulator
MVRHRSLELPAFKIVGKQTWIGGQDNSLFGRFWEQCRADGLFERLGRINDFQVGPQTGAITLGVSLVAEDPSRRDFFYMVGIELPEGADCQGLETYLVPTAQWEVFECRGRLPASIVAAEMYAFMEWLPQSGYEHANAPEMEVYLPGESGDHYLCEFWLPVRLKGQVS